MPPVQRSDPYASYNFLVTVNGVSNDGSAVAGSFTEASGLEFEISPIEYRNGSEPATVRKIPGLVKYTNITLKRGITGDLLFWNWVLAGVNGAVQRADGSIILLDEARNEVMRWNFRRAWPCKYTGPGLNAANNEIAMNTLEICHEGVEIET
jgi:phage tail-like protein